MRHTVVIAARVCLWSGVSGGPAEWARSYGALMPEKLPAHIRSAVLAPAEDG